MKKLHSNPLYTGDMDKECVPLCNALNAVKGIITTDSCCGHDKNPFIIFFKATSFKGLFFVTRVLIEDTGNMDGNGHVSYLLEI